MSEPRPEPTPTVTPGAARPPIVRLPTWVNVVLVLVLLASCSGASNVSDLVGEVGNGSQVTSQEEVDDVCRLLGAVAATQGIDLDSVFASSTATTQCQDAARGAGTP